MLTAIVTNHNYGRYLDECLMSATVLCEDVILFDDGSTDDSLEVASHWDVRVVTNETASGSPVWGSNLGIEMVETEFLVFLDADNVLLGLPDLEADYTFSDVLLMDDDGIFRDIWRYRDRPRDPEEALDLFYATGQMPIAWGGFWRTDFIQRNGLRWRHWESTKMAADFRTCIDWLSAGPSLAYWDVPLLGFRVHEGQFSASDDREKMLAEAMEVARGQKA